MTETSKSINKIINIMESVKSNSFSEGYKQGFSDAKNNQSPRFRKEVIEDVKNKTHKYFKTKLFNRESNNITFEELEEFLKYLE